MTTTPILDTRTKRKNGLYPIYIRIITGPKSKLVKTGFKIEPQHWSENTVKKSHPLAAVINAKIYDMMAEIQMTAAEAQLKGKAFRMELAGTKKRSHSFIQYIFERAIDYEKRKMPVMVAKCQKMVRELKTVFTDIEFDELGLDKIRQLDAYMIKQGNAANTRHAKMKFYRQMVEMAIKDKTHTGENPFKYYEIKKTQSHKDKLTHDELDRIVNLPLDGALDLARDIFLFSYYCKGQRFSDCITLERKHIKDGRIFFITDKVGKAVSVQIHSRLQAIINKYPKGKLLFPYIKDPVSDPFERLRKVSIFNVIVNRNLKVIAGLAGIDKKLSTHIARHTFASQLMTVTDSIHVIKEALAHSDYRTTQIYLKSLDNSYLDKEMKKLYGE